LHYQRTAELRFEPGSDQLLEPGRMGIATRLPGIKKEVKHEATVRGVRLVVSSFLLSPVKVGTVTASLAHQTLISQFSRLGSAEQAAITHQRLHSISWE
jgi:hypothetical protein